MSALSESPLLGQLPVDTSSLGHLTVCLVIAPLCQVIDDRPQSRQALVDHACLLESHPLGARLLAPLTPSQVDNVEPGCLGDTLLLLGL